MLKRIADWLEKISAAAFAVGVFQNKALGLFVSAIAFAVCMWLTKKLEGKQ